MPRTTLDLDASVLAQLRSCARAERKTMGQVASERLAFGLRSAGGEPLPPLAWPHSHMGVPRVDLADKEAVRKALEAPIQRA